MVSTPSPIRGQTSMEFTIILAVVLIIGLIVIGLAMYFSMGSSDVSDTEAKTYWSTQARPLRISDMAGYFYSGTSYEDNGEIALKIENVDTKPITLTGIMMADTGTYSAYLVHSSNGALPGSAWGVSGTGNGQSLTWANGIKLAPSQQLTIYIRASNLCSTGGTNGASSERFKNYVTLYYNTPDFTGLSFKGVKPIKGSCSK